MTAISLWNCDRLNSFYRNYVKIFVKYPVYFRQQRRHCIRLGKNKKVGKNVNI
jgi:hypothetical protein